MARIDLNIFRQSPLCQQLNSDEILELTEYLQEKEMAAGTTVFIENMPGESLYLIQQGTVEISKMLAEGDEQSLVTLDAEDTFGEMAILDGNPRSATARVAESAVLLVLLRKEYDRLCQENPALALKLTLNIVRLFSQRIRENNQEHREMILLAAGRKS